MSRSGRAGKAFIEGARIFVLFRDSEGRSSAKGDDFDNESVYLSPITIAELRFDQLDWRNITRRQLARAIFCGRVGRAAVASSDRSRPYISNLIRPSKARGVSFTARPTS